MKTFWEVLTIIIKLIYYPLAAIGIFWIGSIFGGWVLGLVAVIFVFYIIEQEEKAKKLLFKR